MVLCRSFSGKGNALNLDGNVLGQGLDSNTAPSRLMSKELLIHAVHLAEVAHVVQEHGGLCQVSDGHQADSIQDMYLDNPTDVATRLLKNSNDIVAAGLSLFCNATLDEFSVLVSGNLARYEEQRAGDDGLRLPRSGQPLGVRACAGTLT
jgi:hypothetical protein